MTQLLVLSHTEMYGARFCTNVAGKNNKGDIVQLRPHIAPNEALEYYYFGDQAQAFRDELRPGSVVDIQHFWRPIRPRVTHPEDIIIKPEEIVLVQDLDWSGLLFEYAEEMAYDDYNDLFPGMYQANGKFYRPDGVTNPRSVGYVQAQSVHYYEDWDKLRARVIDAAGNEFTALVKGVDLLAHHSDVQDSLVRLSLAGGFSHENWKETKHPSRCFLMLSHVIEL